MRNYNLCPFLANDNLFFLLFISRFFYHKALPLLNASQLWQIGIFVDFIFCRAILLLEGVSAMKTFKLLAFDIVHKQEILTIPLLDGVSINQENTHQIWILEIFIDPTHRALFEELQRSQTVCDVRVVISFPDNDPAPFTVTVHTVKEINAHISVLMKGTLKARRQQYAEKLLAALLHKNIAEDELLEQFRIGMQKRPRL